MGGSGINWTICRSFAPFSRQITMPTPHHSNFLQAGCSSWCPTNSVKALKAIASIVCWLIGCEVGYRNLNSVSQILNVLQCSPAVHVDSCLENCKTEYISSFILYSKLVELLKMPCWTGLVVVFMQMLVSFYAYYLMFSVFIFVHYETYQVLGLNREDAMDCSRWIKQIRDDWWPQKV